MRQVLRIAREGGCRSVVVEERYIDPDYRSEYSAFWSRRFEERRPLAKRLHFFAAPIEPETLHVAPPAGSYLGYTVLRPTDLGPVGRTVLRPPPRLGDAVLTTVRDRPSLFRATLLMSSASRAARRAPSFSSTPISASLALPYGCPPSRRHSSADDPRDGVDPLSVEGSKGRPLPATDLQQADRCSRSVRRSASSALFYDASRLTPRPDFVPGRAACRLREPRHQRRQQRRRRRRQTAAEDRLQVHQVRLTRAFC